MKSTVRSSLPNISTPTVTYSQRYEHMTKLANYIEMTENQIWKEYEKLRVCLKQLNQEVLYHMEKKAFNSLSQKQKLKQNKDPEGSLIMLDDEKRNNEIRLANFTKEFNRYEERIQYLASNPNLLDELFEEGGQLKSKIKSVKKDNKDLYRKAEMQGKDLINNTSILDRIVMEQGKLTRAFKEHKKHQETLKILAEKTERYKQKIKQSQRSIEVRVEQFSKQSNYIQEQIHFQRYQQLRKQKQVIGKYDSIYKRNYLMKLKQLQTLINSITKHDKVIHETQANNLSMRSQIDSITAFVGSTRKKHSVSVFVPNNTNRKASREKIQSHNETLKEAEQQIQNKIDSNNDKNRP